MASDMNYAENPTLLEFFRRLQAYFNDMVINSKHSTDYVFMLKLAASVKIIDLLIVLLVAAGLTGLRLWMTNYVSVPLANYLQLTDANKAKWPETMWKGLVYSILWLQSVYVVVLSSRYDFLQNPLDIFKGFPFGDGQLQSSVPSDIYWMYALQLGFYVHSIIGTLYLDIWRKDSVMMLLHHALTIMLLELSFLARYQNMGALVLLLHDVSDVLLEFTKVNNYLKDRGGRERPIHEWLANIGFVLFSASWAGIRLYWFPLKVIQSSTWGVYVHHRGGYPRLFLLFNAMLIALQALHVLWFQFILILLYRVATGQQRSVEDTREFQAPAGGASRARGSGPKKVDHSD